MEGIADNLAWLGAAFWLSLAIDWFFEPPVMVRVLFLVAVIGVLAGIFVRQIGLRAFARLTNSNMATVLERRFPHFNDSLLTAVALCDRDPDQADCNSLMLTRVCNVASEGICRVRLDEVFNPRPLRNTFTSAILIVFSVVVFAVACPNVTATWARRSLAMSEELWPRLTRLEIDGFQDGMRKVARGSDVDIVVRADTAMPRVPQVVEIRYREEGGVRGRAAMNRMGSAEPGKDRYQEYVYTRRNVLSPLRFDVYGGDASIQNQWIEVVDNPTITLMLDCEFPAYMDRSPRNMPVTGLMPLPQGTRVTVQAYSNKDLQRVQIDRAVDENESSAPQFIESKDLSANRREFTYALESLDKDTTLVFTLFDTDGIKSNELVRLGLVAVADQVPQVAAQLDGIGTAVTPQARVPLVGRVIDDYGIGRVWFEHAFDQSMPEETTISKPAQHTAEIKLDSNDCALEVRDLKLKAGQKLLVSLKASDMCSIGKGPNVGSSERWLLDLVTPDQLQTILKARELVLRQRFEAIIQETTETRDLLARMDFPNTSLSNEPKAADKGLKTNSEPGDESGDERSATSEERLFAMHMLRAQSALTNSRKSTQEILGLAEAFEEILKQLVNNRIDNEELQERLQSGIAYPLRNIAEKMFPEFERRLDVLQSSLEDEKLGPLARDSARSQADAILLAMRHVLDRMIELQDYDEIVEMLRDVIKMQEQLHEQTDQRHKQIIRELLKE